MHHWGSCPGQALAASRPRPAACIRTETGGAGQLFQAAELRGLYVQVRTHGRHGNSGLEPPLIGMGIGWMVGANLLCLQSLRGHTSSWHSPTEHSFSFRKKQWWCSLACNSQRARRSRKFRVAGVWAECELHDGDGQNTKIWHEALPGFQWPGRGRGCVRACASTVQRLRFAALARNRGREQQRANVFGRLHNTWEPHAEHLRAGSLGGSQPASTMRRSRAITGVWKISRRNLMPRASPRARGPVSGSSP